MIKLDSRNHLCKYIRRIVLDVNLIQLNVAIFKNIPHEMVSDINVLRSRMVDLILRSVDSTYTITMDLQEVMPHSQIIPQALKLDHLLHSLCQSHVHVDVIFIATFDLWFLCLS